MPRKPRFYDCTNCPAHCCSYDYIVVTEKDIARLAGHFEISEKKARKRFTKKHPEEPGTRVMRHKKDFHFGSACQFLDKKTRQCTIYDARPAICRAYPGTPRCGFYDFLMAERRSQDDPEFVPDFTRG